MPPGGFPQGGQLQQAHGVRWGDGSDAGADTVFFDTLGNFIIHVGAGAGSLVLPGGQVLRSGTGAPAAALGDNGDVYFDKAAAATQFFYKKSGGAWSLLSGGSGGGGAPSGPAGGSLAGNYPNPTLASGAATGAVLGTDVVVTGSSAQTKTGVLTAPIGTISGAGFPTASNIPATSMAVWKNTTSGFTAGYANDGGTIKTLILPGDVVVTDYGADPSGVADSTTAFNNAIGALSTGGGTVWVPVGTYKVGQINIGNGTTSAVSTTSGITLSGVCPPGLPADLAAGLGPVSPCKLLSNGATNMLAINGPLSGWAVRNLVLDGNAGSGGSGINILSANGGNVDNVVIRNFATAGILPNCRRATGALASVNCNCSNNYYRNVSIVVPDVNGAVGIWASGNFVDSSSASTYELYDNISIALPTTTSSHIVYGLRIEDCYNMTWRHVRFTNSHSGTGTSNVVYYNYIDGFNWPSDTRIEDVDFGSASAVIANNGSTGTATVNRISSISSVNGQPANPLLANLNYGLAILPHGGEFLNPTAATTAVVWRVPEPCIVTGVYGFRTGGTGATINASHSGNKLLSSDLSVTSTSTWMTGSGLQNTSLTAGEDLTILLQSESGSPTGVAIQVDVQFQ